MYVSPWREMGKAGSYGVVKRPILMPQQNSQESWESGSSCGISGVVTFFQTLLQEKFVSKSQQ